MYSLVHASVKHSFFPPTISQDGWPTQKSFPTLAKSCKYPDSHFNSYTEFLQIFHVIHLFFKNMRQVVTWQGK